MAVETKIKKLRKHIAQRNFFAVIEYAFRIFARQSSFVLGSAWAFVWAVLVILVWGTYRADIPFFRHLAACHQHNHHGHHLPDGVSYSEHTKPRHQGRAVEVG